MHNGWKWSWVTAIVRIPRQCGYNAPLDWAHGWIDEHWHESVCCVCVQVVAYVCGEVCLHTHTHIHAQTYMQKYMHSNTQALKHAHARTLTHSLTQRMYGFGACFAVGWILSLLSLAAIPSIAKKPEVFALMYTFGNLVSLASTMFLWGPWSQIKKMFDPVRVWATIVYLGKWW